MLSTGRFVCLNKGSYILTRQSVSLQLQTLSSLIACPRANMSTSIKRPRAVEQDDGVKTDTIELEKRKKKAIVPPRLVEPGSEKDPVPVSIWENAVVLVDKPQTWTSFDVCAKIRGALARTLNVKGKKVKVGHAGTLDPMATGLLIVCIGKGTKSIDTFVSMTKEYSGTMKLGEETDSYDADGTVVHEHEWKHVTNTALTTLISDTYVGDIDQLPPMFSAIRVNGKRLYESARKGEEVERKSRRVTVERFDITRNDESQPCVDFWVTCSKGTYIRSLAHDLGTSAGCGAHLVALRRESIGEYNVKSAWTMDALVQFIQSQRDEDTKE